MMRKQKLRLLRYLGLRQHATQYAVSWLVDIKDWIFLHPTMVVVAIHLRCITNGWKKFWTLLAMKWVLLKCELFWWIGPDLRLIANYTDDQRSSGNGNYQIERSEVGTIKDLFSACYPTIAKLNFFAKLWSPWIERRFFIFCGLTFRKLNMGFHPSYRLNAPHHDWVGPLLGIKVPTTPSSMPLIHQKPSVLATTPCIPPLPNFELHNSWGMLQWR